MMKIKNFLRFLFASVQIAFICPPKSHRGCDYSSISLARGQNAPRKDDITFLRKQSKLCGDVKSLVDTAILQSKTIKTNPSVASVKALRNTYESLLKYQREGMIIPSSLLEVLEDIINNHRRIKYG
jgi:hypothetical protein